ncbi:uncharacterized protein An04g09250 [Aspergillus niger]|uniref:Sorting nexin MVP1 n=2 Tax=Aspergillus niger TaxID=5061 RepID=A2QK39_ASPNC|nr:uncharacterized protein An04g09250 [Aspergillus niger]CAK39011.1 unnamed protein product [Aspergillus niger]
MSLFGTSPEDSPLASSIQRSKASLFADEPPYGSNTGNASSSLFADDDSSGSPWMSNNANKRTSKEEIVKTLLPDSDVPETYIDAYDLVLSAGDRVGTGVGLTSIREILSGSGLSATDQAKILNLVISGDSDSSNGLGRGEFSVLLALVGLAQEGEDLTFDAVDDRRKSELALKLRPITAEVITITLLPEKEGMFMFQHRNYEVKSARRQSTVVRRYSDFVWLLDCLHKRYPFRQLPLLPPKRLAVNGTHLAADSNSFLEKRRRGLVRFTNALVRHPVLSQEQLVIMFLTVPTELSVWRKQATISVQDEFTGRALPPDLEDSLPSDLTDMFDTVRSGVKRSAEVYINLCTLLERLAKRNEGLAADHLRFSLALQSLTEMTRDTYAFDTNDVPLLNEGIKATARHLSASQSLLEDEARAWEEGMLEDLKRQRDCLVSVREMFDRRDRYARNNIPQLEKRIENSERKLQDLRARTQPVKPGEIEKVEESIVKDKESIVHQHARGVFIKECIRNELMYFQQSQYHISRLHQDWSQERVKYSELQADNWRSLSDQVEGMPLGD